MLERATAEHRAAAGDGRKVNLPNRINQLGRIARGWLNVGEIEKARPLIREGLDLVAVLPKPQRDQRDFLPIAARLETDRVLSLIAEISSAARRRSGYVAVAEALANEHPDQAERVFQLIDDSGRVAHENRTQVAIRMCRLMAKTDPERARRIIAGLKNTQPQACLAWSSSRPWVPRSIDKPASHTALAESIKVIDRLIDPARTTQPTTAEPPIPLMFVAANPATSILPIVEIVAPERLEEVFWKAVALHAKGQHGPCSRYSRLPARGHRNLPGALRPPVGRPVRDAGHHIQFSQPGQPSLDGRSGMGECRSSRRFGEDRGARPRWSELDSSD